ncbi:STAS domain-containing protein [Streptomyces sp. NPDC101132]|uniref:STAS domain-containing protein n=1 Tax=Streptomyces sp. NPDC101132 TaxID=3366110 RepID=UPI0038079C37
MNSCDEGGGARIEVEARDGTTVLRPHGEMDIERAADFHRRLLTALARDPGGAAEVVVDLRHLTFCDSAGLHSLLRARTAASRNGHRLSLAAPMDQFLRLLDLTGTRDLFDIRPAPPF